MKNYIVIGILIVFVCMENLNGQETSFQWPEGKKAAISLSFDDARLSHPGVGQEFFSKSDARVTFYVLPGALKENIEGWKKIVKDGHEIGNHTLFHPCTGNFPWAKKHAIERYTLSGIKSELIAANQQINELLGVTPVSFAYTCGNTFVGRGENTKSYVPIVAELFQSGRGWLNEAPNDPEFADLSLLQGIEMDGKSFIEDIKPLIDQAKTREGWLLLAGHEIGEDGFQTTNMKMLEELITYAQNPDNELWLAPVGEIASYINNQRSIQSKRLKEALSFCTTFDNGLNADFGKGDTQIYWAKGYEDLNVAGSNELPANILVSQNNGYFGNALKFEEKIKPVLFYHARGNVSFSDQDWDGTLSMWLNVEPAVDLAPGFTDPIQITDSGYDDAAIWVDFSDKNPRKFRLGVFGDRTVWNPNNIGPDENPGFRNRLIEADGLPFKRGRWTHVALSFSNLNTELGAVSFYIDGQLQGSREITEPFTWNIEKAKIFLGLNYIGYMDEIAIFNRNLSSDEVRILYELPGGIKGLLD